jgi:hypothetical protein
MYAHHRVEPAGYSVSKRGTFLVGPLAVLAERNEPMGADAIARPSLLKRTGMHPLPCDHLPTRFSESAEAKSVSYRSRSVS